MQRPVADASQRVIEQERGTASNKSLRERSGLPNLLQVLLHWI